MDARVAGRRWLRYVVPVLALLLLGAFIGCRIVGAMFRARLTALVKKDLKADLYIGSVIYRPPYTFLASDIRLFRPAPDGTLVEILQADRLGITLDGLSDRGGPAPIRNIVLDRSGFHIGRTGDVFEVDQLELSMHPAAPSKMTCQLSLNDVALAGSVSGTLDFASGTWDVDRLSIKGRARSVLDAIPWPDRMKRQMEEAAASGDIALSGTASVRLRELPRSTYQFTLDLADAQAKVSPWRRSLDHGNGRIVVKNGAATGGAAGWLPVESTIDHLDFSAGTARIRIGGGRFTASPKDGNWRLAQLVGSIDMGQELLSELERSGWFFEKAKFQGPVEFTGAANGPFRIPAGQPALDAVHHEFLIYPHGISMQPRNFREPIVNITGGPIACRGGVVTLSNLTGSYGPDKLLLRTARLTLEDPVRKIKLDDLRTQVKFEEIDGTVLFGQPGAPYPGVIGKVIDQLRPTGSFVVGGGSWYAMNRRPPGEPGPRLKADFFIRLIGDGGTFAVTNNRIPLTEIHGQATISPLMVDIPHFDSKTMGGECWAEGKIAPGRPMLYQGTVGLRGIDMRQFAAIFHLKEPTRSRLTGVGYLSATLAGAGKGGERTPSQELVADGELQILRGDFWSVPAVQEVASQVRTPDQLGDGDAAAVFHIADRTINLEKAAVNSPLLGLEGSGTIGFDKTLFLTIVAAPLGDWRDKMRQAGIPAVGDVLGAVQKLLNTVQGALLFQFRVTGTLAHPEKSVIAAPVISDSMAALFGQMLRQDRNGQLLNDVKGKTPATAPAAQMQVPGVQ